MPAMSWSISWGSSPERELRELERAVLAHDPVLDPGAAGSRSHTAPTSARRPLGFRRRRRRRSVGEADLARLRDLLGEPRRPARDAGRGRGRGQDAARARVGRAALASEFRTARTSSRSRPWAGIEHVASTIARRSTWASPVGARRATGWLATCGDARGTAGARQLRACARGGAARGGPARRHDEADGAGDESRAAAAAGRAAVPARSACPAPGRRERRRCGRGGGRRPWRCSLPWRVHGTRASRSSAEQRAGGRAGVPAARRAAARDRARGRADRAAHGARAGGAVARGLRRARFRRRATLPPASAR